MPILQIRELSLREVKKLVQSHTVYKGLSHIPTTRCCSCSSQDGKETHEVRLGIVRFLKVFWGKRE